MKRRSSSAATWTPRSPTSSKPSLTRSRRLGPNFQEAVDKLVTRLKEHDVGENAPKPGEKMLAFILPDENGQMVSLEKLLEKGPVAVTFHRGHWCPYCRINTRALAEAQGEIASEGGQVAAITPDREYFKNISLRN